MADSVADKIVRTIWYAELKLYCLGIKQQRNLVHENARQYDCHAYLLQNGDCPSAEFWVQERRKPSEILAVF